MSAIANLTSAVQANAAAVDRLVAAWNLPNPTEAEIQAAADSISAQTGRINALLTPAVDPVPEPVGGPSPS